MRFLERYNFQQHLLLFGLGLLVIAQDNQESKGKKYFVFEDRVEEMKSWELCVFNQCCRRKHYKDIPSLKVGLRKH